MKRLNGITNGERYIGNKTTKEVHDLENEKPGCRVDELIISGNHELFTYWYESKIKDYKMCVYCFGFFIEVLKQTPE